MASVRWWPTPWSTRPASGRTTMVSELRLDLDPIMGSTRALAPLIDPNQHSCGTVPPHGVDVLAHPEHGLYLRDRRQVLRPRADLPASPPATNRSARSSPPWPVTGGRPHRPARPPRDRRLLLQPRLRRYHRRDRRLLRPNPTASRALHTDQPGPRDRHHRRPTNRHRKRDPQVLRLLRLMPLATSAPGRTIRPRRHSP